jgi:hypothetical protein
MKNTVGDQLLLPDCKTMTRLFPRASRVKAEVKPYLWEVASDDVALRFHGGTFKIEVGSWMSLDGRGGRWGLGRDHCYVEPSEELVALVRKHMTPAGPNDQIFFKVVERARSECLVTASNSSIIGSRWICLLPRADVRAFMLALGPSA